MANAKQTYKYISSNSILGENFVNEYNLSIEEYYKLYSFFVTYSLCGTQSYQKRSLKDYGWESESIQNNPQLYSSLKSILDLYQPNFQFTNKDNLDELFTKLNLPDGIINDLSVERGVLIQKGESNHYFRLFYRIRDGFAHGKFCLRYSDNSEKMIVIQDNDNNVTARLVIKLSTLLSFISVIDRNHLI